MTIQRPLDLPTARRRPRARRSRTKKRSARITNRNAPPRGGNARRSSARAPSFKSRAFGGRHSLRRSRTTIARAPPNRARRDDRRSSHLARRRPCIAQKVSHLVSYLCYFRTFLPRAPATKRFADSPNRGGLASRKKILGTRVVRVGRVLVSASCSSGVRHMLEFASYVRAAPERARTRRGCTTRGRGVLGHRPRVGRHAGRSGSATWLGTGGTTRRRNLSVPKGIYLDRSDDRARPGVPAS